MKRILVLLVASAASCSTPSVSVVPYAVRSSLEGAFSSSELNASAGTTDLGLDDPEMVFGGRIDLAAANSHWSISHYSSVFDGQGQLPEPVTIGEVEYEVGDTETSLDVDVTSALWTYDWGLGETAHLGLGLGVTSLGVNLDFLGYVDHDLDPSNPDIQVPFQREETLPIPLIGVRLGGDIGPIRLEASYSALEVSAEDAEVSMTDLDVYAGIDIFGDFGSLVVGYRELAFDAAFDDADEFPDVDFTLGGPYVGIRVGF